MIYLQLFWSFFQVGLFSIGGGFAALPLIEQQVVVIHGWKELSEFADVIAISGMMPGSISVNAATFTGLSIAGVPGAIAATVGCLVPTCIIVAFFALLYFRFRELPVVKGIFSGLYPVVAALIASAGLRIIIMAFWSGEGFSPDIKSVDIFSVVLFACALAALKIKIGAKKIKISPIFVMLGCAALGGAYYMIF
jgi:chromate transporter